METSTTTSLPLGSRERWLTTALLGLGLITFAVDASNTTLILPQIMTNLRVELYEIHWALTAPGIARTVMIAATGWLSGLYGPRTLYLLCYRQYDVGSLGSMLAWDWPSLIFFRILAGIGGGMIPQLSQAIFYQIFPRASAVWPLASPCWDGRWVRPSARSWVAICWRYASWRVVYAVTLPLSGLGFVLCLVVVAALASSGAPAPRLVWGVDPDCGGVQPALSLDQANREGWDSQIHSDPLCDCRGDGRRFCGD